MNKVEDEEILGLLADPKTEEKGFKMLMLKYQESIYFHIKRMVHIHEDANDLLQNTFIKVYKNIHKFEQKAKLYTWIYTIATNETKTFLKKRTKKRTNSLDDEYVMEQEAKQEVDGDEIIMKLNSAIETLPEKQKQVFNMRYYDEMTYDQISAMLGTSVGGLKASYHHAVKKIEAHIKAQS